VFVQWPLAFGKWASPWVQRPFPCQRRGAFSQKRACPFDR